MRDDHPKAGIARQPDRLQSLRQGSDLVEFDQDRVGGLLANAPLQDRRVGDKEIVANQLYAITLQLDRAEAIAEADPELEARRDALSSVVQALAARAPLAEPGSEHRLQVQRELRSLVESAGLELMVFEWVLDGEDEAAGLSFGRVRLQLEGQLRNVAEAHVGIEAGYPNIFVRDLTVTVRRGSGGLASTANGIMELDLYYRHGDEA